MIYRYIAPAPALQEFVKNYLIAHFAFDQNQPIPSKPYSPKPEQGITFFPKGYVTIINTQTEESNKAPSASIFGQQVSRYNFGLTTEYLMVRVHFQPGALYRMLRTPLSYFTDRYSDAAAVINEEVQRVNEWLGNCTDYKSMITVVEDYLLQKIKNVKEDIHPLDRVAATIFTDPTRFSLDQLARGAYLSPRQFNRRFTERMGVGPKLYSRIVRFHRAYQYKETHPECDWLTVALLFGYNDYQHLVKDFKAFSDVTPNIWIRQDNLSPERILGLE